jgi:hypothetical protein
VSSPDPANVTYASKVRYPESRPTIASCHGDAERVQIRLRDAQGSDPVLHRLVGDVLVDQCGGTLVQRPGRLAVRIPHDPAVGGIRRVPRDAGDLQCLRVHPRAVSIPAGQVHGAVRDDPVEHVLRGIAAREEVHRPSTAHHPLLVGVGRHELGDDALVLLEGVRVGQVAVQHVEAPARGVAVCVLEAGHQHATLQVDDLGSGRGERADLLIGPHAGDAAILHRDRLRPSPRGVDRVHGPVHEHEVGRTLVAHGHPPVIERPKHTGAGYARAPSRSGRLVCGGSGPS